MLALRAANFTRRRILMRWLAAACVSRRVMPPAVFAALREQALCWDNTLRGTGLQTGSEKQPATILREKGIRSCFHLIMSITFPPERPPWLKGSSRQVTLLSLRANGIWAARALGRRIAASTSTKEGGTPAVPKEVIMHLGIIPICPADRRANHSRSGWLTRQSHRTRPRC